MCAAALLLAAMTNASAQLVLFSGAGYVTAATGPCSGEGIFVSLFMIGAYMPADLGSNGPAAKFSHSSLPQFVKPHATGLQASGALTGSFKKVDGTTVTPLGVARFKPSIKIKTKPSVVDETTQSVDVEASIKNGNGVDGCDFTLNLIAGRRPG
jgi:hypothetical protein